MLEKSTIKVKGDFVPRNPTVYLAVRTLRSFDMPFTGVLKSISSEKDTIIYSFSHMLDPIFAFEGIEGFPVDRLPRLNIPVVKGASCIIHATPGSKLLLEIWL